MVLFFKRRSNRWIVAKRMDLLTKIGGVCVSGKFGEFSPMGISKQWRHANLLHIRHHRIAEDGRTHSRIVRILSLGKKHTVKPRKFWILTLILFSKVILNPSQALIGTPNLTLISSMNADPRYIWRYIQSLYLTLNSNSKSNPQTLTEI